MVSGLKEVSNKEDLKIHKKETSQTCIWQSQSEHFCREIIEKKKMTSKQDMKQTITKAAIEAAKAAVMAVREAESSVENTRKAQPTPRVSGPESSQHSTRRHQISTMK